MLDAGSDGGRPAPAPINNLKVYPNVGGESITVAFDALNNEQTSVQVFNLSGARVAHLFDGNTAANATYRLQLNTNELPAGIYIYSISTATGATTGKFVVSQ